MYFWGQSRHEQTSWHATRTINPLGAHLSRSKAHRLRAGVPSPSLIRHEIRPGCERDQSWGRGGPIVCGLSNSGMEKGSGSRYAYGWTSRLVLPGACVAPTSCLFLHLIVPGGYIGSHSLVVGVTTALLCFVHVLLAHRERVGGWCADEVTL